MAIKKTVELEVKAKGAIQDVNKLKKGVQDTSKAAKNSEGSFKKMKKGIGLVGGAFKALGIGLIIAAFVKLQDALSQNQVFADKVSIALETVSITFQQIISTVVDKGQKVVDFFQKTGSAITRFFKKDIDGLNESMEENNKQTETAFQRNKRLAKEIVNLRNEVKLAEAEQRKLQLTYQRDAELQRQIRDNTSLTIDERIEANNKLGKILEKQFNEEKKLADKRILLAQKELSTNETNVDLKVAVTNAETELIDLQERIVGQRSEQLTNLTALENEYKETVKETPITLQASATEQLSITDDMNNQMLLGAKQTQDALQDIEKQGAEGRIKIDRALAETRRNIVAESLGNVASLLGEQSKAGKALAVGQALINTYSAAAAALAPPPVGAGPIFGPIAAIGAVAAGMANVKQILSTKLPGAGGGGGGGGPEPAVPQTPQGLGPQNVNMEAIEQPEFGTGQPTQAFVVENDISNAQALQQELDLQSTL